MKNIIILFGLIFIIHLQVISQNVAINTTGVTPNASAMLDISSTNTGLLIPRVALSATNNAAPVTSPATSLMVYNTATAGTGSTSVTPGYYFWNGSIWVRVLDSSAGDDWHIDGNAGTTVGTNFLGTTDAVDFAIYTNNAERIRVQSGGNVGIGTTAPLDRLVVTGTTESSTRLRLGYNGSYNNVESGRLAFDEDVSASGICGFEFHLDGNANNLYLDAGCTSMSTIMTFERNGDIGIGTTAPTVDLHIADDVRIDGGLHDGSGYGSIGNVLMTDGAGDIYWADKACDDLADGFETLMGNWTNVGGDDYDWSRHTGTTSSTNTGPTAANEGSYYIYVETSSTSNGDQIYLQTEMEACTNPSISFDYHMYFNGYTDGTLVLEISTNAGATWNTLWSVTGDQGNVWHNDQTVSLAAYANTSIVLRFRFTTGASTNYQYDCALDDINLYDMDGSAIPNPDDDWVRDGNHVYTTYEAADSVVVGDHDYISYDYDFAVCNGSASGTNIGLGSVEYLTDEPNETTINNDFSPADDLSYDLGGTTNRWDVLYADDVYAATEMGIGTTNPGGIFEANLGTSDEFVIRVDNNIGVEMRSGTTLGTPYIDFSNDAASDYDARIRLITDDALAVEGTSVGIGTTTPTGKLHVDASTTLSGTQYGIYNYLDNQYAGNATNYGFYNYLRNNTAASNNSTQYAFRNYLYKYGTGSAYGVYSSTYNYGSGYSYGGYFYSYRNGDDSYNYGLRGYASNGTYVYGVYGYGTGGSTATYAMYASGNFTCTGTKAATVRTEEGPKALYCQESPENWFEDFGNGEIENGKSVVNIREDYLMTVTIDDKHPMKVFITPNGQMGEWWVEKQNDSFILHAPSAQNGTEFDFRIVAKRKGYEDLRLKSAPEAYADHFLYPDVDDVPEEYRDEWQANAVMVDETEQNMLNTEEPDSNLVALKQNSEQTSSNEWGKMSSKQQLIENLKTEMKAAREDRNMELFEILKAKVQELNKRKANDWEDISKELKEIEGVKNEMKKTVIEE